MPLYSYEIGSTFGGMTNVESLTVPLAAPKATAPDFSQPIDLADGLVRGGGWLTMTWSWAFMTQAQYDQLRTFCSGKSAAVFIATRKDDFTYDDYTAVLVWPEQPERDSGRVRDLVLTFRQLVEYTP
jgi:hypothetical protein